MELLYKTLRPLLFALDAETAHHVTMRLFGMGLSIPLINQWLDFSRHHSGPSLQKTVFGLSFRNPIGLAAGFDKDAKHIASLSKLGFGFIEIGTLTPRPQVGNPKPRLFRLPADAALINRMGFNNDGVDAAVRRLDALIRPEGLIIGGNIGKNKDTTNEDAAWDYRVCMERLRDRVDYFVVNVSSPNTPGLRDLQEKAPLRALMLTLQEDNHRYTTPRPLLLKIAPDLTTGQLDDVLDIAAEARLSGIVATNTTISRSGLKTPDTRVAHLGSGGLSGAPLFNMSATILEYLISNRQGELPIISAGGIMDPKMAQSRLDQGASLVQIYTGLIYGGPGLIAAMLDHLEKAKMR